MINDSIFQPPHFGSYDDTLVREFWWIFDTITAWAIDISTLSCQLCVKRHNFPHPPSTSHAFQKLALINYSHTITNFLAFIYSAYYLLGWGWEEKYNYFMECWKLSCNSSPLKFMSTTCLQNNKNKTKKKKKSHFQFKK